MPDFNAARFAQLFVNSLAVLGGFLAGYLLAALLAHSLDRVAFRRKSPPFLHRVCRLLGGVALAVLVAFIVFGHGQGWTLLGGGLDGTGDSEKTGTTQPISMDLPQVRPSSATAPLKAVEPTGERIRVTILGGSDVKTERFYVIGEDPPRSLVEAKDVLRRRTDEAPMPPSIELHFNERYRLPPDHPAVLRLLNALRKELKLNVILPADSR